jgi:hypothetical protein
VDVVNKDSTETSIFTRRRYVKGIGLQLTLYKYNLVDIVDFGEGENGEKGRKGPISDALEFDPFV